MLSEATFLGLEKTNSYFLKTTVFCSLQLFLPNSVCLLLFEMVPLLQVCIESSVLIRFAVYQTSIFLCTLCWGVYSRYYSCSLKKESPSLSCRCDREVDSGIDVLTYLSTLFKLNILDPSLLPDAGLIPKGTFH